MTRQQLGVCYYPEHCPESQWLADAAGMRDAGISFVRIGEFAWSRLEPKPDYTALDWLDRAIDTLHNHGLKVVLGTPTATPPKWLVDRMPAMVAVDANGRPRRFGSRRHYCFSYEPYALECERIVRVLAERFGQHPGVAAWQTDNEYGCHDTIESYSDAALTAFRGWCQRKYGTIERLNEAWGNVFWSMELTSFDELELPHLAVTETKPAHRMDFQRFSSDQVVRFNKRQTDIIRTHSPGRSILHNFMGSIVSFDHWAVSADLDAVSWDSYPLGFLERDTNDAAYKERYLRVGDPDLQAFHHDLYRGCGRGRWWVMEQQPGPVNWAPWNPGPAPGAVRLWAWEAFAAGAEVVSWFPWRQAPFAQEQMHEALLLPNSEPNEAFFVSQSVARELASLQTTALSERSPIALVFDYQSAWAWSIQPHGRDFSYLDLIMGYYRALRRAGASVDIVPPTSDAVSGRKLVLIPGLYTIDPAMADTLMHSGAVVLGGPRTGSKTPDFQIPRDLPPGPAGDLFGVRVRRVESLRPGIKVAVAGSNVGAAFEGWREFIKDGGPSERLLESDDGAVMLTRHYKAYYLAGRANAALLDDVIARVLTMAGLPTLMLHRDLRLRDHGPWRFAFNHGPETIDISALTGPAAVKLGSTTLEPCAVAAWMR